MQFFAIFISGILTNNIVFQQSLGICPYLGVSKKMNDSIGMGLAVTFVVTISSAICWLIFKYVLTPLSMQVLQTLVFILLIASLVQLLDIVLKRFMPSLYNSLGVYLALITTNCAILGTANAVTAYDNFLMVVVYSISIGVGFLLALILMAGVREKMQLVKTPKFFKGFAISLIIAAIMSMAFTGLGGISFGGW